MALFYAPKGSHGVFPDLTLVTFPNEYCKYRNRISPVVFLKQKEWSSYLNKGQSVLIGIVRQNSQNTDTLGILFSS